MHLWKDYIPGPSSSKQLVTCSSLSISFSPLLSWPDVKYFWFRLRHHKRPPRSSVETWIQFLLWLIWDLSDLETRLHCSEDLESGRALNKVWSGGEIRGSRGEEYELSSHPITSDCKENSPEQSVTCEREVLLGFNFNLHWTTERVQLCKDVLWLQHTSWTSP